MLPSFPGWDAIHPVVVHFPIALLLIAPLLVVAGLVFFDKSKGFMISAFVLMALGTAAAFVATATGDAAGEFAESVPGVEAVLENHEELAETTRNIFAALTAIFGAIVFGPLAFRRELARRVAAPLCLAFLLFYAGGSIVLVNAAHEGGRLVHEFGVRAMVAQGPNQAAPPAGRRTGDDDDD